MMENSTRKKKISGDSKNDSPRKKAKHHKDDSPNKKSFSKTNQHNTKRKDSAKPFDKNNKKQYSSASSSGKKNEKFSSKNKSPTNTTTSTTTTTKSNNQQHREQKQARQSQRKHSDVVAQAKVLWNQLRQKQQPRRRELMTQLMPLLQGKVKEICLQHDAARVVQAALQFGTTEQRQSLIQEMTDHPGSLAELAKIQYAHFCVTKAIQYTYKDDFCCSRILKNIIGSSGSNSGNHAVSVPKLAVHAVASRVIEELFTTLPKKKLIPLKLELFGPHVALFASGDDATTTNTSGGNKNESKNATNNKDTHIVSFQSCLETIPQHREATLKFVRDLIHKGMEKNMYALNFFQDLMREYGSVVSGSEIRALLASSSSSTSTTNSPCDQAVHLLSSRAGAKVLCDWISYGTAKDRKSIAKSLKGFARSALLHPQGSYLALIRLAQLTDDTVTLHKYILSDLLSPSSPEATEATSTTSDKEKKKEVGTKAEVKAEVATTNEKDDSKKMKENKDEPMHDDQAHPLLELAMSEQASKFLLFILLLQNIEALRKLLDPYELSVLQPGVVPTVTQQPSKGGSSGSEKKNSSSSEKVEEVPTSKKDAALRQKELFQYLQQPLIDLCTQHAKELLLSRSGSAVLRHVYQTFRPPALVDAVVAAVLQTPHEGEEEKDNSPPANEDDQQQQRHQILQDRIGHLAVKNLILVDATVDPSKQGNDEPMFAKAFWQAIQSQQQQQPSKRKQKQKQASQWTQLAMGGNRGAFVVAALLQVKSLQRCSKMDIDQAALEERLKTLETQNNKKNNNKTTDEKDKTASSSSSSDGVSAGIRAVLKEIKTSAE
ncbi:hypothetical protein ACA910_001653 [Epithemia clementina (nom. ined.)]